MKLTHILFIAITISLMLLGCSSKNNEKPSPLLDKAVVVATEAAKKLVATDHSDTLAMQNSILEAKAQQAEFQVTGDTAIINAYNRAFKKYLLDSDPELAKEMFIERPKNLPEGEFWDEFEQLVEDKE